MDQVNVIKEVKKQYNAEDAPVITFGGSYSGMLAAWMRMKYPEHVLAAVPSGAPVRAFEGSDVS